VRITFGYPGDVEEDLERKVESASLLHTLDDQDDPPPPRQDVIAAAQADYRRILTALYDEGYYGPTVSIRVDGQEAAGLPPVGATGLAQRVEVQIDPGPRFDFGRTEVSPVPQGTVLPEGFRRGEPAATPVVRDAVRTGVEAWRELGYPRADVAGEEVVANHARNTLDVGVQIAPGPQLTFGPLLVTGNENVRTARIVQIAGLPTGEVYSPDAVRIATERLRRTGAFSTVVLTESETDGPGGTLPVTAEIVEQVPRRIGFGIEVSSIDGLGVSAFWLHRNLLGGAERFRVEAEVNQIGNDHDRPDLGLSFEFTRPGTFGLDRDLYANGALFDVVDEVIEFRGAEIESGFTQRFGEDLTVSAGLGLRYAEVIIPDLVDESYLLVTFPIEATLDRRDDQLNAKSGFFVTADVTPFLGIENAENGSRLFTDARVYRSFGQTERFTFAGRLQFGTVSGPQGSEAPADFLFLSGGGGTVRGQEYESLGVEEDGTEIGGNSFLGTQLEARIGITDAIEAVAFYDTAVVSAESFPGEDDPTHSGAGLGVRYNTGIGPIRLDIATPTSGDEAGQRVELYIGIGQAF